MYTVSHNGLLLAVVGNVAEMTKGQNFGGKESDLLQWGLCRLEEGQVLQPHIHKQRHRQGMSKTIEFLYIVNGQLETVFYSLDRKPVLEVTLHGGDYVCLYDGGHGFRALTEDTKFLEVKLGPYIGVGADKEKF